MRHGDKINNLGRTTAHRKALLSNLACQLIQYKRITTTLAKAKSLRMYVEPMITKSKADTVNNRRLVFAKLQDKEAIKELFGAVSDKVASRPGGYTRIIKLAPRMGDAAEMAMIELVDFNTIYTKEAKTASAKKTRRSRGAAKPTAPKAEAAATTETPVAEAPATEATETKEEGAAE
jgi:large subunit ribosomal protein L17